MCYQCKQLVYYFAVKMLFFDFLYCCLYRILVPPKQQTSVEEIVGVEEGAIVGRVHTIDTPFRSIDNVYYAIGCIDSISLYNKLHNTKYICLQRPGSLC